MSPRVLVVWNRLRQTCVRLADELVPEQGVQSGRAAGNSKYSQSPDFEDRWVKRKAFLDSEISLGEMFDPLSARRALE